MKSVVIDANIAIYAAIPSPKHDVALKLLENLIEQGALIYVPRLWFSEVATGIRKSMVVGGLSRQTAVFALQRVLTLPLEKANDDVDLYIQAYSWAERLGQLAVYDAVYLALAEQIGADFYTADKKLFHRCQELGVSFVKLVE